MIIRKYGIELRSLTVSDLEQVRGWRNDPFVRERMFFQDEITQEDQKRWFSQLDDSSQYYIIVFDEVPIGVINVKSIDWKLRTGEAGIFIGVEEYRNSFVSMLAILCMMDAYFDAFDFTKLTAIIRADNVSAKRFNLDLGYQIDHEDAERIGVHITPSAYKEKTQNGNLGTASLGKSPLETSLSAEESHLFLRK
ncbi:MAG: RimJ/RimL family protein N-acetyltransferase [Crocinitomicaceae bacterium]|jgi:RimJ/RimL family protein N-acetyltransferase